MAVVKPRTIRPRHNQAAFDHAEDPRSYQGDQGYLGGPASQTTGHSAGNIYDALPRPTGIEHSAKYHEAWLHAGADP
ncbi:hypothetical protein GCM10007159_06190 [Modicisalibacter luteus]|nr:hypothetical protein GCM10007159_06190 [Halomonas lutea]